MKVVQALDVPITADDVDISHKLNGKGEKSILVKFTSHKAKTKLYKKRAGLKHVKIADLYPEASAATRVEGKKIFVNENLTSFRRDLVKKKPMRKEWTDCCLAYGPLTGKYLLKLRLMADQLGFMITATSIVSKR